MRRGSWAEQPVVVSGQAVVSPAWLAELGVPRRTITRKCESGDWQKLLPRAILLNRGAPTDEQRLRAALLYARAGAVLTGLWALRRYGLRRIPQPREIHVLVIKARNVHDRAFVRVERTRRMPRPCFRGELPLAPIHRAIVDTARLLPGRDQIRAIMAEAVQRRLCTAQALLTEIAGGPRAGSARLRAALAPVLNNVHSVAEADAWELWQRSGLPPCQWNVKIFDEHGNYIAMPDAWCEEVAFAWEIDSREFHSEDDDFATTVARNARYAAAGVVVLQTLPAWLKSEPDKVIAQLRAAYETAKRRPRPDIRTQRS
ncbi:hypothetical protein [Amycolatopsis sp. NPDC059657]|uniref:hypothetical protein n=1 Tax=Amycolatopsis sp. NPDC059657 TaxID=3346899 RepID=UPI00366F3825